MSDQPLPDQPQPAGEAERPPEAEQAQQAGPAAETAPVPQAAPAEPAGPGNSGQPRRVPAMWIGLALAGILAVIAIVAAIRARGASPAVSPAATATQLALVPTIEVHIPTVTSGPAATRTAAPPSATAGSAAGAATAAGPASSPTAPGATLTINLPANVRSGPGLNYPVIAGLDVGSTPEAIGRSAAADWFVIALPAAADGRGWVSVLVSEYSGDASDLPVLTAPPPPPATRTPAAPTAAPTVKPPVSSRGLTGTLTLCSSKTVYAVMERICFVEKIVNTTTGLITYGVLGVQAANLSGGPSQFQTSWSGDLIIDPGCTGPTDRCGGTWEDGIHIRTAGTYALTMQICYSSLTVCQGGGEWETLTPAITVTVQ